MKTESAFLMENRTEMSREENFVYAKDIRPAVMSH